MTGRLDSDTKRESVISKKLEAMPKYVSEWNDSMKASGLASTTRSDYLSKIHRFLTQINKETKAIQPIDLTKLKINAYLASLATITDSNGNIRESSDSYKQTVWCCLNSFFSFMEEYGYIDNNPINIKKKPKNKDLERINSDRLLLTKNDFEEILETVRSGAGSNKSKARQERWRNRDLGIIMLLMGTGMRETALTEIDIDDIDLNNNLLNIVDKGNKTHTYYLNNKTIVVIKNWIEERRKFFPNIETHALFLTYQGNRMTAKSLYKLIQKYSEEALGFPISPHKIRSGFCSIMYDATRDIEKVRRMVGHSNVGTTQRYIATENTERKEAANIMEMVF